MRVAALVISTGIALKLTPFIVHTLGDRSYGLWTLVTTIGAYYGLLDLGLSSAVTRHIAGAHGERSQQEVNQIASTSLAMYLAIGSLVFICGAVCAAIGFLFFKPGPELVMFRKLVLISGLATALVVPARVFVGLLNANLRFEISASLEIASYVTRAILTYVMLKSGASVIALGWINLIAAVGMLIASYAFTRRVSPNLELRFIHCARGTAGKLVRYGSISLVAQIADLLRFQVDALVVASFLGVAAVTHYNVAGSLAQYFISLMLAATGALGPVFSRLEAARDSERMRDVLHLGTKVSVALATFICFGLIAWGRPFIVCWMGAPYLDAYPPLVALAIGVTVALWQTSSLQLLYGTSKHGMFAVFNSLEGVANLILSLVLVRRYGLLGVALGTMIPMALTKLLFQPWYVCRTAKFDLGDYYRILARGMTGSVVALVLPLVLTLRFAAPSLLTLALLGLSCFCCFAPVTYLLLFSAQERDILKSISPIGRRRENATALAEAAAAGTSTGRLPE